MRDMVTIDGYAESFNL